VENDRWLRRDRQQISRSSGHLGLDCLEHAPVRDVTFASMAARLEARRTFDASFLRACRAYSELSISGRPTTLDDLVEWEMAERRERRGVGGYRRRLAAIR
jgi:hypothetical protein